MQREEGRYDDRVAGDCGERRRDGWKAESCLVVTDAACSAASFFNHHMYHPDRRFSVVPVDHEQELAERLIERIWPGCTGFLHGGHLFLNDTATPDETQEFAVFRDAPDAVGQYRQVSGLTVEWMGLAEVLDKIREVVRGDCNSTLGDAHRLSIETPEQHRNCMHCE